LGDALQEIVDLYRASAKVRGIGIRLDVRSNAWLASDQRGLTLIFGNLLDNAVRYSPAESQVDVSVIEDGPVARVEVRDRGPGLPEAELERVFERFYRVAGDTSEGSGLGLATVATVLRQLGGRITLANRTDGPGLVARVEMPVAHLNSAGIPRAGV
jgi:signal transduction histidine kinase